MFCCVFHRHCGKISPGEKKKKRRTMVHKSNFPLVRERLRGETICSVDACSSDTGYLGKKRKSPR